MTGKAQYTVVVADDEDELREAVCTMTPWQEFGFRLVGSASNGLDALQLVEKHQPDLLLTDIRMPFISGIELARQVREIRPATNIAFLSGYDDFQYAKQAIQYNIISYMLKPLTVEGLAAELKMIREKIDTQFAQFRQTPAGGGELDQRAALLMPLVLDDYADPEEAARAEDYARQCGLLRDPDDRPCYTVMVTTLRNGVGTNCTTPAFVASVNRLASKYLRSVSFYTSGKVVSVLLGNPSDFTEYLHILADEIPQMADRVLGSECHIGVSRMVNSLATLHGAYREAMDALRQGEMSEGGAHFIWDLAPRSRAGPCCAAGPWTPWDSSTWTPICPGVPEREAGRQPQLPERLHQEIYRRDLYEYPHPQADGGGQRASGHLRTEDPGYLPAVRLHRPALFQLLLQKILRRVPQRHAPAAGGGEGG